MRKLAEAEEGALPFGAPWAWGRDDRPSVKALQGGLLCAPILQAIILNRFPEETSAWVDDVCKWRFRRVVPCHLANDVMASPAQFKKAFAFLNEDGSENGARGQPRLLPADCFARESFGHSDTSEGARPAGCGAARESRHHVRRCYALALVFR